MNDSVIDLARREAAIMRAWTFGAALTALVLCVIVMPRTSQAEWPPLGRPVSTAAGSQTHSATATDGAGGAIVVWQDSRSPKINLFAHHVFASGELDSAWPDNGRALLTNQLAVVAGGSFAPRIVSDGAGGAIVAWLDLRDSLNALDVYAHHLLASGQVDPEWKVDGTALCAIAGTQDEIVMVPDGGGGAIVAWMDGRPGASQRDLYAQHLLASGIVDPRWPVNGLAVSTAAGLQAFPAMIPDGAGGAIIAWDDSRSGPKSEDIFAQHVLGSGVLDRGWPVDGLAVCTAAGPQGGPTLSSDGSQGAIVAWSDSRVVGTTHIFAHHVLASGAVDDAWPGNGLSISQAGRLESRPLGVSDGAGGAIVCWQALDVHLNMYAQHVLSTGAIDPRWPAAGKALSVTARQQSHAEIASDGIGGAVVAWEDSFDVVAQHVLVSGVLDPSYPDTGRVLVGLPSQQGDVSIVATGGAGAIVSWTDLRARSGGDIFALQVVPVSTTDVPPPVASRIRFESPRPNPARGPLTLRFALSQASRVRLDLYDVGGRKVRQLAAGVHSAGPHEITWDLRDWNGMSVESGVYFARLEVEGRALTQRLVTVE